MKEFIFGERNGIYIIDLGKTVKLFREAEEFVTQPRRRRQDDPVRRHQAAGAGRDRRRSAALRHVSTSTSAGSAGCSPTSPPFSAASAACATSRRWSPTAATTRCRRRKSRGNEKEKRKLQKNLEGIRHMSRLPDAVFVVDTRKEKIAVDEARKLKIPVIGIVDTNCDPDEVDFVIPGQRRRAARDPAVRVEDRRRGDRRPRHARIGARRGRRDARRRRRRPTRRAPRARSGRSAAKRPPRRPARQASGADVTRRPRSRPALSCTRPAAASGSPHAVSDPASRTSRE